jgi:hypothetical protein
VGWIGLVFLSPWRLLPATAASNGGEGGKTAGSSLIPRHFCDEDNSCLYCREQKLRMCVHLSLNVPTTTGEGHLPSRHFRHSEYPVIIDTRHKGDASHIIDTVWLYRSPMPWWGGGGYFNCSNDFYLPSRGLEGEWSASCVQTLLSPTLAGKHG